MGNRSLQILLKHYWRWIPTDDLSIDEMASLESSAAPLASNHAHLCFNPPQIGTEAIKTMIQSEKTNKICG
jgi:hypothetical protein